MNVKVRLTVPFIVSLLSSIGFGLIAQMISDQKIAQFDGRIIAVVQGFESESTTVLMKFITFIGSALVITILTILVGVILYIMLKHRQELILFVIAIAGSALLNSLLKAIFHRQRPEVHRIIDANGYSFPSGHSMAAFSFFVIITFLLWRHIPSRMGRSSLIIGSSLMILGIGISRIYLGVHFPSDVLGGYLASGSWLAASIWAYQIFMERLYQARRG